MTVFGSEWSAHRLARGRPAAVLLILAILVGLAVRIEVQRTSPIFASDSFQSLLIARSLLDGRGFTSGGAEHTDLSRSVLYPLAIAATTAIVGDVELAARIVVLLAAALIVVPLFFMARSAFGPAAALATLPFGALSCESGASSRLLSTSLFVLLATSAIALAWSAAIRSSRIRWLCAGSMCGLAALARPEGIVIVIGVALWAGVDPFPDRRFDARTLSAAATRVGYLLLAFFLTYGPYVAWVSAKLGRFMPLAGIEYIQSERRVSDHLVLRETRSPVPWTSRARFMLTRDHRSFYLETYFLTGAFPDPDAELPAPGPRARQTATTDGTRSNAFWRRFFIVRNNLLHLPKRAAWGHFLPPMVVALAAIGLAAVVRLHRSRHAALFLLFAGASALGPFANHIEDRFFYLPFALGLLIAANGWAILDALMKSRLPDRLPARLTRIGFSVLAVTLVAWSGARHSGPRAPAMARAALLQSTAPALTAPLPPGPVMSIDPHFAYWSGRAYEPIPYATQGGILDFARSCGAVELALEGKRDLDERPDLEWLTRDDRPPAFKLIRRTPHPEGGELLVFALDLSEAAATSAARSM